MRASSARCEHAVQGGYAPCSMGTTSMMDSGGKRQDRRKNVSALGLVSRESS
jgi:hypothetical protein